MTVKFAAFCLLSLTELSRATRLHKVLMDLQHKQLQQLTDWLDVTEARIKRMGAQPLGPDLEDVKHQVEEHKVGSSWPQPQACGSTGFQAKVALSHLNSILIHRQFGHLKRL